MGGMVLEVRGRLLPLYPPSVRDVLQTSGIAFSKLDASVAAGLPASW